MDWLIALITLSAMEIVLGIDNIIFIAILAGQLPQAERAKARTIGLIAALGMRILLLLSLNIVLGLTEPVFHVTDLGVPAAWVTEDATLPMDATGPDVGNEALPAGHQDAAHDVNGVSWRDIILITGGLFLIIKSVLEVHHKLEGSEGRQQQSKGASLGSVLLQIALFDIIFSLDSVITAVGMAKQIWVMIAAVVIAVGVMLVFAGAIGEFVEKHPTIKILALSFLILIGVLLFAEGIGTPVNKGYIYFAMAFSLVVEMINMRIRQGQGVHPTLLEAPRASSASSG